MKKKETSVTFLLMMFLFIACSSPQEKHPGIPEDAIDPAVMENPASASGSQKGKVPKFEFQDTVHDFGKIIEGEKVSFAFRFKNVGDGELIIRAANGSCGCTVPEWPKDPIQPGGTGIINVTFNSEGREGMQHKSVTLVSNTMPNTKELNISAEVQKSN